MGINQCLGVTHFVYYRFAISWSGGLSENLKTLGLEEIFDPKNSEMKGVALNLGVPLGQVFQNARINVGELGIGEILNNGKILGRP